MRVVLQFGHLLGGKYKTATLPKYPIVVLADPVNVSGGRLEMSYGLAVVNMGIFLRGVSRGKRFGCVVSLDW